MPFNINEFKSNISRYGYLSTNKYEIIITLPPAMRKIAAATNAKELLKFRTKNFEAPGIQILNVDVIRYGLGTSQKMPFSAKFADISFSVLLDKNSELWNFWYQWHRLIFNFSPSNENTFASYVTEYKTNYATTLELNVYNENGYISNKFNFYDIYPVSMKEVELHWEQQSTLAELELIMTYKEYTSIPTLHPMIDLT